MDQTNKHVCFHFLFFAVLEFELRASTTRATPPTLFCVEYFRDRVLQIICLGWLQTTILLISAF
jgi:hypothetical protein